MEQHIGYRHGYQGQEGGADQAADDHGGEFGAHQAVGVAECQGEDGEDGGEGGHQDGAQAGASGLNHGVQGVGALLPQLVDESNQHDGVSDDDADKEEETHHRRQAQGAAGNEQGKQCADYRQGHTQDDDERVAQRTQGCYHHQIDQRDADGHGDIDIVELLINVAGKAALMDGYAGEQGGGGDDAADFGADGLSILSLESAADGYGTVAVVTSNYRGADGGFDGADSAQLGIAVGAANVQALQFVNSVHGVIPPAHYYIVSIPLKVDVGGIGAIDPGADLRSHGTGVQAIAAGLVQVNGKGYFLGGVADVGFDIDEAGDGFNAFQQLQGGGLDIAEVGAGDGGLEAGLGRAGFVGRHLEIDAVLVGEILPESAHQVGGGVGGEGNEKAGDIKAALAGARAEVVAGGPQGNLIRLDVAGLAVGFQGLLDLADFAEHGAGVGALGQGDVNAYRFDLAFGEQGDG